MVQLFTARDFTGDLIDSPKGRWEWIPDENLTTLNLWASEQVFLPWLDKGSFFSAKFISTDEEMQGYEVDFHLGSPSREQPGKGKFFQSHLLIF